MHELSVTKSIVSVVSEAAKGRRVRRVTLDVGKLAGVLPEAIAFCFDAVAKDTALDGATLDINEIPGRCRCRDCGEEFAVATLHEPCACGSHALDRLAGQELRVREMELEEAA